MLSGRIRQSSRAAPMTEAAVQVQKLLRQQAAIARFGSFALRERDLMKILTEAVRVCADGLSVPFSKVCQYRAAENDLLIVAAHGWQDGVVGNVVSRADMSSPQGRAFTTGEPSIIDNLQKDAGFDPPPFYAAHGIVSIIDVIIKGNDDQPYGILEIDNDRQHDYDQHDINFLTAFANVLAEAVSTASRGAALQVTVDQMKALVEEKDRLLDDKNAADLQLRPAQKMEAVSQLTNAILNLALNARDAMPDGGKLTIETSDITLDDSYAGMNGDVTVGDYVLVAVTDSGHGIPADILDHVFEPFFTTKDVDKGSGLGLSMVYGFVKQSNGHIKIYSEQGHGTTVRMYLPQAVDAVPAAEPARAPSIEGGHETILVVEDDHLVRAFVVSQIQSLGYLTLAAVNAAEAMVIINGPQEINLLFTDMIMPGPMNGRQLADAALRQRTALKILFTSGYSNEAIIHHGHLDAGVLLLAKPYRKSDLARMIRAALAA